MMAIKSIQANFLIRGMFKIMLALCACIALNTWADTENNKLLSLDIPKLQSPEKGVYISGQPDQYAFQGVAKAGVEVIVNLRPASELDWDEKSLVESLGMRYVNIPVAGANGITSENAASLSALLNELEGKSVLVHCASGNRVGALSALAEYQRNGGDVDAAIDSGKKWGLSGLENLVREKLSE